MVWASSGLYEVTKCMFFKVNDILTTNNTRIERLDRAETVRH